ncbi:MAG: hypothetical protein A2406_02280 [Candidatus Komeilibacteria bacterium RIFOXYC1_FULL_37_11]|uniref:Uncharacterized protein n=1 Tax=Candidatus Komeilibacteria bacterium RIFOXYC1_FULL_37_11 TaxID=1798555 RepID=A0A1G2C0F8_9BACT|nr:MAG: hypothetical protein A2406_02280 [Candidatus Komeilibacteria bacterium RIFOXYC1_FULL_37_11]OGY95516.1 MAG: hypothetical protein A2611_02345 [Candidatus Komeilibacteria bacterium RIFOXYD1_FULL_37_29]OGY96400.1 MAG: hypothetical protein A2543_00145 [Candidatus Komeilibacteria bacterium RIFOXYD2_FULL_37_8]
MANKAFSKDFITALLSKANLTDASGKIDATDVERLAEQLEKKMGLFLLSKLSAQDINEYYELVEKNAKTEDLHDFLQNKIPNFSNEQKKFLDDYAYNFFNRTARIKQALK